MEKKKAAPLEFPGLFCIELDAHAFAAKVCRD